MIETTCSTRVPQSAETAFPFKLHVVLDEAEKQGFSDVISWQGANAFMIHRPKKFEESVMKEYFHQSLYSSFQKQLELHGFKRIPVGERFGGSYTHILFLRGKPNMGRFMITTPNAKKSKLKRSKLRRGLSAPISQSRSRSTTNRSLLDSSSQRTPRANEEDFEPLPHNEEDTAEYCQYDQQSAKKHRSNYSWSPICNSVEDSAIVDWLSSTFGGTENNSSEKGQ